MGEGDEENDELDEVVCLSAVRFSFNIFIRTAFGWETWMGRKRSVAFSSSQYRNT